ncbi:MAG TPA: glycine betaine ABC transporter substrate-binding protein [Aestuariivirgaceae bacterium]|nr:glycine betaine ABC transporter substrate-binding protein [Aestuariivirgaceae bacterium]
MSVKFVAAAALSFLGLITATAVAAEPEACSKPRIADGGWTDNTAQNGFLTVVLKGLGYQPQVDLLSVPVILTSMKQGTTDVWLDNWMPSQTTEVDPYLKDGSIKSIGINLEGAGYGPVVPSYVADAGVKDLKDLGGNAEKFSSKIYGIEPGNDGNRILQSKIDDPANNLKGWQLVESSEQGMLAQADKEMAKQGWIAFLAWTPHPVMGRMAISYLTGFEKDGFGPASIHTLVRSEYPASCPNVAKLLANLKFTLDMESAAMEAILAGKDAEQSATTWFKANPAILKDWLAGVTTFNGQDGLAAVEKQLGL